ncbi:TIGR02281 family clan AA aspartic protease [Candidatus Omnitrophota bacterium]
MKFLKTYFWIVVCATLFLNGCSVARATGQVAGAIGKVTVAALKTTGTIVHSTGKVLVTAITHPWGKKVVKLDKRGTSLYANVLLNRKTKVTLLVDTGATYTQISKHIARQMGISEHEGESVVLRAAGGYALSARIVTVKDVRVGGVRARDVEVVVLDTEASSAGAGLLGMSFLDNFIFEIDTERPALILKRKPK